MSEIPNDQLEVSTPQAGNGTEDQAREERLRNKLADMGFDQNEIDRILGRPSA